VNFVVVAHTPLAPDRTPARIAYRRAGPSIDAGPSGARPLVFLHGGWGYEMYPFDRQVAAFTPSRPIVIPDRSGYGESPLVPSLSSDFHQRAMSETLFVLDALFVANRRRGRSLRM
jgi:pimeloyl-ACP methyl ester carboxylesterase